MNITSNSLVEDGANIDYSAGVDIDLLPGFEAVLGAEFHAYIEGCSVAKVSPKGNKLHLGKQEDNEQIVKLFLPEPADVKMELFSLVSGKVDSFGYTPQNMDAGHHVQTINLSELNTGVYICKVIIADEILTAKFFVK